MSDQTIHYTHYSPCLKCGRTKQVIDGQEQPHECDVPRQLAVLVARAYWSGHDRGRADGAADERERLAQIYDERRERAKAAHAKAALLRAAQIARESHLSESETSQ